MEITCGVILFQECFYQCSPYVYQYAIPNVKGAITGKEILLVFVSCYYFDYWQIALFLEVQHTSSMDVSEKYKTLRIWLVIR